MSVRRPLNVYAEWFARKQPFGGSLRTQNFSVLDGLKGAFYRAKQTRSPAFCRGKTA